MKGSCPIKLSPNLSPNSPNLEKERGDDADDGVVEHDGDDEELREGGEGDAVQGSGEVTLNESSLVEFDLSLGHISCQIDRVGFSCLLL